MRPVERTQETRRGGGGGGTLMNPIILRTYSPGGYNKRTACQASFKNKFNLNSILIKFKEQNTTSVFNFNKKNLN